MFTLKKLNRNDQQHEETSQTFEKTPPPSHGIKGHGQWHGNNDQTIPAYLQRYCCEPEQTGKM